jgi:integrase
MGSRRTPLQHPLAQQFQRAAESLTTALGESSVGEYHGTVHLFLTYLGTHHPQVRSLEQLHRDPHILGWLAQLRSHMPPLAKFTLAARIVRLHRLLEELAWTQQLPALARLLGRDDVPRRDHLLPRPLTPEQDQRIQEELQRRNDLASNALLLLRHTGMRIGECVDLSLDCLRPLGPTSGSFTYRSASSALNAGFPWTPWFVKYSIGSALCVHHRRPTWAVCYCLGSAVVTC